MPHHGFAHEHPVNQSTEWYTPPEIFEALGETFDLDPCSPGPGRSFVPATRHLTIEDDGLASKWQPHEFVFCNPPYGRHTGDWVRKLAAHGHGIALVFARTDVSWFQQVVPQCGAVCFVSGRIPFYRGSTQSRHGRPGAGSMLIAFGDRAVQAVIRSGLGVVANFVPPASS